MLFQSKASSGTKRAPKCCTGLLLYCTGSSCVLFCCRHCCVVHFAVWLRDIVSYASCAGGKSADDGQSYLKKRTSGLMREGGYLLRSCLSWHSQKSPCEEQQYSCRAVVCPNILLRNVIILLISIPRCLIRNNNSAPCFVFLTPHQIFFID